LDETYKLAEEKADNIRKKLELELDAIDYMVTV
jgi:hypothetical protein